MMAATIDLPVRRAKLRQPHLPRGLVPRPRLLARLDQSLHVPLTLVAAPAGFGKTTLLAEWSASQLHPVAWLTLDASDRELHRFVTANLAALEKLVPGIGAPVLALMRRPDSVTAIDLGVAMADVLHDLPHHLVLVMDDFQLAASAEVEQFLAALLHDPPAFFHLVLSTRNDPGLPLARMRLRDQVLEVRAADLRFHDEEAGQLLDALGYGAADAALIRGLQEQTGGWVAGLRLATLARPTVAELARLGDREQHLMDFLVEEVLASQPATTQDFLLRTAIVDRLNASLADALCAEPPPEGSRALLAQLLHDSLLLEPADDDSEWLRYHPLFRTLLRHQLELRLPRDEIAALHLRASAWFAAEGQLDQAIQHRVAAGDVAGAASLVERHAQRVLAREDWTSLDGWLQLLPDAIVRSRPGLMLARGWVSHFSGRSVPISAMTAELNALLATIDAGSGEIAAWEAERDVLSMTALLWSERDPGATLHAARRAAARIPAQHRLAAGLASFWVGLALQAAGRTGEAIRWFTAEVERSEDQVDAGLMRTLGGLMFVHRQAGNVRACEEVSRHALAISQRADLPVATAWTHWMLGWIAYERNELSLAAEHFSAIAADHRRVHFHTACEAMFGLALVYQAQQMPVEAAGTLRRLLDLIFDANALEYLPLVRGFAARLALQRGERDRAIGWMETELGVSITSNSLDCYDHAYLTRIRVLLAEGSASSLAWAWRDVVAFQEHTGQLHQQTHAIEILALEALVCAAQGNTDAGLSAMARAVELAAAAGFVRTFVDLGSAVAPLLKRLAATREATPFLTRLLEEIEANHTLNVQTPGPARRPGTDAHVLALMTVREAEVLECLARHLSYQEIGAELFISPETVKTHAANIYSKLGVGNRRQALARAQALGWSPRG